MDSIFKEITEWIDDFRFIWNYFVVFYLCYLRKTLLDKNGFTVFQIFLLSVTLFKACVRYFSLFLKYKCISSLVRTKYTEKIFNLQLFFLPTVSPTFILSCTTTRYPPRWNFLFRKNNCMCNQDNARDVAACPDE